MPSLFHGGGNAGNAETSAATHCAKKTLFAHKRAGKIPTVTIIFANFPGNRRADLRCARPVATPHGTTCVALPSTNP